MECVKAMLAFVLVRHDIANTTKMHLLASYEYFLLVSPHVISSYKLTIAYVRSLYNKHKEKTN